jgi:hypothetical protein
MPLKSRSEIIYICLSAPQGNVQRGTLIRGDLRTEVTIAPLQQWIWRSLKTRIVKGRLGHARAGDGDGLMQGYVLGS